MFDKWKSIIYPAMVIIALLCWVVVFVFLGLREGIILLIGYTLGGLSLLIYQKRENFFPMINRSLHISWTPMEEGQLFPKFQFLRKSKVHPKGSTRKFHIDQPGGPNPREIDVEAMKKLEGISLENINKQMICEIFDELAPIIYEENNWILKSKFDYEDEKELFYQRIKYSLAKRKEN